MKFMFTLPNYKVDFTDIGPGCFIGTIAQVIIN